MVTRRQGIWKQASFIKPVGDGNEGSESQVPLKMWFCKRCTNGVVARTRRKKVEGRGRGEV